MRYRELFGRAGSRALTYTSQEATCGTAPMTRADYKCSRSRISFSVLSFFFLAALPLQHFLFGHLIIVAGGEHRAAFLARVAHALLPASGAVKVADAADGIDQRAGLDQQLADFAQEVGSVIRLDDVGQRFLFEDRLGVSDGEHRDKE